jgi:hypothetical protein
LILTEGLVEEVVETVTVPADSPFAFGWNCKGSVYVPPFAATERGRLAALVAAKPFPVTFRSEIWTVLEP